jgi:hypothetical protein
MNDSREEAVPIARLMRKDGTTVGWVYRWNTSELSILWIDRDRTPARIEPAISPGVLSAAEVLMQDKTVEFLDELSSRTSEDSEDR